MIRKLKSGGYRLYSRKINPKTGRRYNLGTLRRAPRPKSTNAPCNISNGTSGVPRVRTNLGIGTPALLLEIATMRVPIAPPIEVASLRASDGPECSTGKSPAYAVRKSVRLRRLPTK